MDIKLRPFNDFAFKYEITQDGNPLRLTEPEVWQWLEKLYHQWANQLIQYGYEDKDNGLWKLDGKPIICVINDSGFIRMTPVW